MLGRISTPIIKDKVGAIMHPTSFLFDEAKKCDTMGSVLSRESEAVSVDRLSVAESMGA